MPAEPDTEREPLELAAEFPPVTREQWRAAVAEVLARTGGTDDPGQVEGSLAHTTYDKIRIAPLYTADDTGGLPDTGLPGHPPFVRGAVEQRADGWDVRTRHAGTDAAAVNRDVLQDLERGATSLWLALGDDALPVERLAAALNGVLLDLAPVVLDAGARTGDAARTFLELLADTDLMAVRGSLGCDPIGARARTGASADLDLAALYEQAHRYPQLRVATVDATVYHDAGASDAQEIGIATAVGVAYLRALEAAGVPIDDALARIEFRFAVTAEQFPSIAKLRAARRVWDRIAELSGASDGRSGQAQHAVTSAAMMTRRDPWVNMLRTTVACFAAAVGGAEAITVAPFDSAIGVSDDFARRIARNTHAVLHDESSLGRVTDAAGGSWFVDSLTDELARAAWSVFTDIEKSGGALAALDDGVIDGLLGSTRTARADDIAHRRAPITGVSEFAFVDEQAVSRPAVPENAGGLLPRIRYVQDFEAMRERTDAVEPRPAIYLATLGPVSAHSARAGFAANLFQAAGLRCVTGPIEDFADADTSVACLCASDKLYDEDGAAAVKTLRETGASWIWLAGRAEVDGVDGTVFAGCDALAVLRRTLDTLGVA